MTPFAVALLAVLNSAEAEPYAPGLPCLKLERGDTFDCVCNQGYCDTIQLPETLEPGWFYIYTSSASKDRFNFQFTRLGNFQNADSDFTFTVATGNVSQEILGFGGALTDATGYNLDSLPPSVQAHFIDSYFSKTGIEYSFVRVPIGATDFSPRLYTNLNSGNEFHLTDEDCFYKIRYLQEILKRNENVRLLGSAWLPPEWMLQRNKVNGRDTINPEYYRLWAQYHSSFFDSFKRYGINFWGATTGNEIVFGIFSVPWLIEEHQIWINEHLGPALEESGHGNLKLLFLDDQTPYLVVWQRLLLNNVTNKYIDGAAVHWYLDEKTYLLLEVFHALYPDKLILNTEASLCKYEKDYEEKLQWYGAELYAQNIIEKLNSKTNGWIDWNLALDVNGGPNYRNNTCTAAVIVNPERGEFYKGPIFYAIGHFSKFIPPGSKQVGSTFEPESKDVRAAAFRVENHPWDVAVVLLNMKRKEIAVRVCIDDGYCGIIQMPPRSIVSAIAKTTGN